MTGSEPVTCIVCGTQQPAQPLTWTVQARKGPGGPVELLCEGCTRAHVRSMEAQLDREHW